MPVLALLPRGPYEDLEDTTMAPHSQLYDTSEDALGFVRQHSAGMTTFPRLLRSQSQGTRIAPWRSDSTRHNRRITVISRSRRMN